MTVRNFLQFHKSAKQITNPGGKKARWRGKPTNHVSSTTRVLDRTIPFAGTKTLLMQFNHRGLTQENVTHRIQLNFQGLRVLREDQINTPAERALARGKNFFKTKWKGNNFFVEKPTIETKVRVRCSCLDSFMRWNWWNFEEGTAFGPKPRKYIRKTKDRPSVNPEHNFGICKHEVNSFLLMETSKLLKPGSRSYKGLST